MDRRRRQEARRLRTARGEHDIGGHAPLQRRCRIGDRHAHGERPRDRIDRRRDLADLRAVRLLRFGDQHDHDLLGAGELRQARLRHRDRDLALGLARVPHHRLPCRDDLSRFGRDRRDHAVLRRNERRVRRLILRHGEIGLRLLELRAVRVHRIALRVERRRTDELLLEQCLVALVFGAREFELVLRCCDLRPRGFGLQADVGRIEPRENLSLRHARAGVDGADDDLAGNAEREIGLVARLHLAREHGGLGAAPRDDLGQHDRARGLGLRLLLRAAGGGHHRRRDHGNEREYRLHRTISKAAGATTIPRHSARSATSSSVG